MRDLDSSVSSVEAFLVVVLVKSCWISSESKCRSFNWRASAFSKASASCSCGVVLSGLLLREACREEPV